MVYVKKDIDSDIVIVSPEPGDLSMTGLDGIARFISAKGGGQGEVVAAKFVGWKNLLGDKAHLVVPNFKRIYQKKANLTPDGWFERRLFEDSNGIELVDSRVANHATKVYPGGEQSRYLFAQFQENARHILKKHFFDTKGLTIFDLQDQYGGGILSAYLRKRGATQTVTLHNSNTDYIHIHKYKNIGFDGRLLSLINKAPWDSNLLEQQSTGIKNATLLKSVGKEFMLRLATGQLAGDPDVPYLVTKEVSEKYNHGQAEYVPNPILDIMYPENLPRPFIRFSERTLDITGAINQNKALLFNMYGAGVDPATIAKVKVFTQTSRADPQKGIIHQKDAMENILKRHDDVIFYTVSDPSPGSEWIVDDLINFSLSSKGRSFYSSYTPEKSLHAYALSNGNFGASTREPFGQNDVVANIHGGLATNTNIDGYKDKIIPLSVDRLKKGREIYLAYAHDTDFDKDEAYKLTKSMISEGKFGNGVLFENSDVGGITYGIEELIKIEDFLIDNPDLANGFRRLLINYSKMEFSLEKTMEKEMEIYQKLSRYNYDRRMKERSY